MEILTALKNYDAPVGPREGWRDALLTQINGVLKINEAMRLHTSGRVGGNADVWAQPADLAELKKLLALCEEYRVPQVVLGLGSNVLVRDGGIRGVVINLAEALNFLEELGEDESSVQVKVGAGYPLPKLVEYAKKRGLAGLEYLYGIPGSVGGSLRMNAGTKKGEMAAITEAIEYLNPNGVSETIKGNQLKFSYRHLKIPSQAIILSGNFKLTKDNVEQVSTRLQEYRDYRHQSQPLEFPSWGSMFKNPENDFAARLIQDAGLKDVRVGNARISPKHANFIVNEGNATAQDVLALMALCKDKVRELFDIKLEPEVKILGED